MSSVTRGQVGVAQAPIFDGTATAVPHDELCGGMCDTDRYGIRLPEYSNIWAVKSCG